MNGCVVAFLFLATPALAIAQNGSGSINLSGGGLPGGSQQFQGGLGGGGMPQARAAEASDWLKRTLIRRSMAPGSIDLHIPPGLDGYECDLAHEMAFARAEHTGLQIIACDHHPAIVDEARMVDPLYHHFRSWRFTPGDRLAYFSGIRSEVFVLQLWYGSIKNVVPFPGGQTIRVMVRPQLGGSVVTFPIPYHETYILSQHGVITYQGYDGPGEWKGKSPIMAIVQASPSRRDQDHSLAEASRMVSCGR